MAQFHNYPFPSYSWQYQGVDYAMINGMDSTMAAQLFTDGARFVGRYLWHVKYPYGKGLSAAEAQWYFDAGLRIFLYYEALASDALGGYDQGNTNGINALTELALLNVPAGVMVCCCCDTAVTDAQAAGVVMDYIRGFRAQLEPAGYRVAIYGGQNVMAAAAQYQPNVYRCQAGAWGYQEFDPIDVRQWLIAYNGNAQRDGFVRIQNINISNGYAFWRNYNVDLCSAPDLTYMWGDGSPVPPSPGPVTPEMPFWMWLKIF